MTRTQKFLLAGGVAACAIAALLIDLVLAGGGQVQRTNDAYVTADFSVVAPKVAGLIDLVEAEDNQRVRAGQELAHIDDRDYRAAVAAAEATLAGAQADVENLTAELARQTPVIGQADATVRADEAARAFANANATRYRNLSLGGAGTIERQQQAASDLQQAVAIKERDTAADMAARRQLDVLRARRDQAVANVQRARAALDQARLNLSYTHVLAPVDGVVGQRGVRVGHYVAPGTALLAVVPLQAAYVLANYQETQLAHVRPGQHVRITVDAFPGRALNGVVDSLAPASGVAFSPIPPDNATGNFTKVVQRLPLKVLLDRGQPLLERLQVGMSVEAAVDTRGEGGQAASGAPDHLASR